MTVVLLWSQVRTPLHDRGGRRSLGRTVKRMSLCLRLAGHVKEPFLSTVRASDSRSNLLSVVIIPWIRSNHNLYDWNIIECDAKYQWKKQTKSMYNLIVTKIERILKKKITIYYQSCCVFNLLGIHKIWNINFKIAFIRIPFSNLQ